MMMRESKTLLFFLIAAVCLCQTYEDLHVAIIDFEPVGIQKSEAAIVSDKFRNVLFEKSAFRVMERDAMEEVLKEQGFQQTGVCNSNACFIEAGQLLGVNYLIVGRVSGARDMLAFSVRLIEVRTGEVVAVVTQETKNELYAFVSQDIPRIAIEFANKAEKAVRDLAEKRKVGLLFIKTDPEEASVSIDGNETGRKTPVTFSDLTAGIHTIEVEHGTSIGFDTVEVKAGRLTKSVVSMSRGKGNLIIRVIPFSAQVQVDSGELLDSPVEIENIAAGTHHIQAKAVGFKTKSADVFVKPKGTTEITLELTPIGFILVPPLTVECALYIDGELLPEGQSIFEVSATEHSFSAVAPNYVPYTEQLNVLQGDTIIVAPKFVPKPGQLSVISYPSGADLFIDGEPKGKTPAYLEINPGMHTIQLEYYTCEPLIDSVLVEAGQTVSFQDTFRILSKEYTAWQQKQAVARKLNLFLPGSGEMYVDPCFRSILFLTTGLASDCIFGIAVYQYFSHTGKYYAARYPREKDYFSDRRKEDKGWIAAASISSAALRTITYMITRYRIYK